MLNLSFVNVPSNKQKILKTAFDLACKRLGISDYNRDVTIELSHLEEQSPKADGCIYPALKQETITRAKMGKQPKGFNIELRLGLSLPNTIATLCHELIHLKQWINGDLSAKFLNGQPMQFYQNIPVQKGSIPYKDLPWEKEAHEGMYTLAMWVILQMEKKLCKKNDQNDHNTS